MIRIIKIVKKAFDLIKCGIQIWTWIQSLKLFLRFFRNIGANEGLDAIASLIGASSFASLNKLLNDTEKDVVLPAMEKHTELSSRIGETPSNLNGMHKPNYHSTVILEATYAYDSIKGIGSLILIFNPEGFGWKPRSPQIVTNVSEKEMAMFISSKSWGNFWRENFMVKRTVAHQYETTDWMTGENFDTPPSMDLDEWIENQAMLDPEDSELANETMNNQINLAIDRNQDVVEKFIHGFENGTLGRPFEENGLRVTDAIGNRMKNIPKHLQGVISQNPFLKEIAPYSNSFKKFANKWRQLKGVVNSSNFLSSFSSTDWVKLGSIDFLQEVETGLMMKAEELSNWLSKTGMRALFSTNSEQNRLIANSYINLRKQGRLLRNQIKYVEGWNKDAAKLDRQKERFKETYGEDAANDFLDSSYYDSDEYLETLSGEERANAEAFRESAKNIGFTEEELATLESAKAKAFKELWQSIGDGAKQSLKDMIKFPTCWKTIFKEK